MSDAFLFVGLIPAENLPFLGCVCYHTCERRGVMNA
jgi:hypothetical protein